MTDTLKRRLVWLTLIGALLFVPALWLVYWPGDGGQALHGYVLGRDFINIWVGPKVAESFGSDVLFDPGAYHKAMSMILGGDVPFHNWSYPPHALFFAAPLSALPYTSALAAWAMLGLAVYLAAVAAGLPRADRNRGLLFAAIAPASLVNMVGGQDGFFTAALMLGAILLLERRPWLAGILAGLLTVKPYLALLLGVMLIAAGAWRAITAAVAIAAILFAASAAMWGLDPWQTYLTHAVSFPFEIPVSSDGFLAFMQISPLSALRTFAVPASAALAVQAVVTLLVIAVTAFAVRRTNDTSLHALLVASGSFLASPYAFSHDLPVLTGAILWAMARHPFNARDSWLLGAAFVLAPAQYVLHAAHFDIAPLIFAGVFYIAARMIFSPEAKQRADKAPALAMRR